MLAADEFAVPGRAVGDVPSDPIHTPHDVLAAEEFAIPGGGRGRRAAGRAWTRARCCPSLLLVATILLLMRRHRVRGRGRPLRRR